MHFCYMVELAKNTIQIFIKGSFIRFVRKEGRDLRQESAWMKLNGKSFVLRSAALQTFFKASFKY